MPFFEVYEIFFHKPTNRVLKMSENSKLLFPSLGSIASPLQLNKNIYQEADTYFFCLCLVSGIFQLKSIIKMFISHCVINSTLLNTDVYISQITEIFMSRFFSQVTELGRRDNV